MKILKRSRVRWLIAGAVVLAAAGAWCLAPWQKATKPRFDEAAWQDAVAVLKEEVGAAAVDKGVIIIRREPVVTPARGEAVVDFAGVGLEADLFVKIAGGRSCIVRRFCEAQDWRDPGFAGFQAAPVDGKTAERIWATLKYLDRIGMPYDGDTATAQDVLLRGSLRFVDHTLPYHDDLAVDYSAATRLASVVKVHSIERYIGKLSLRTDIAFSSADKDLVPALSQMLGTLVPPKTQSTSYLMPTVANRLELTADRRALGALARLARLKTFYKAAWPRKIPLVRSFLPKYDSASHPLPDAADGLWMIKNLGGLPDADRYSTVSALAADPGTSLNRQHMLLYFIGRNWPERFGDAFLPCRKLMPARFRAGWMMGYDHYFGTDLRAANASLDDESKRVRAAAHYVLYRRTKDKAHIAKLMELASTLAAADSADTTYAAGLVFHLWREDRGVGDIPRFFREHLTAETAVPAIYALRDAGDSESIGTISSIATDPAIAARLSKTQNAALDLACIAARQLAESTDAAVVDALIKCVGAPPGTEDLRDVAISGLGRTKSAKALGFLKAYRDRFSGKQPAGRGSRRHDLTAFEELGILGGAFYGGWNDLTAGSIFELESTDETDLLPRTRKLDRDARWPFGSVYRVLAERYSEEELCALLADESLSPLRGDLYGALHCTRNAARLKRFRESAFPLP